jgi:hypothetical protein
VDVYMVVLRIVHILAGTFWVGAALTTFFFLAPTAREIGPAAGQFMTHLAQNKRLPDITLGAGGLTVLAGLLMYWRVTNGLDTEVLSSAYGVSLTVGALCAIAALALGGSIVRPSMVRAISIGREAAAAGGPTPEQQAQMQALQGRVRATGAVIVPLLIVAVAGMAAARYL